METIKLQKIAVGTIGMQKISSGGVGGAVGSGKKKVTYGLLDSEGYQLLDSEGYYLTVKG